MKKYLPSAITALSCSLFFTVVLPLQTYLGNRDMLGFRLCEILPTICGSFLLVFLLLFVLLRVSEKYTGLFLHIILLTGSIFCYLEVGVLSFGMPALNGNLDQFCKATIRKYLDIGLLAFLLVLAILFYRSLKKYIVWLSVGFAIMAVSSIFDAQKPVSSDHEKTRFDAGFCNRYDAFKSVVFSKERNVLFFILDATPGDIATQIFQNDATLRDKFSGFVQYDQNIGLGEKTIRGVPSLATGKIVEKDDDPHQYLYSFWGERSFLNVYADSGYAMYVCPGLFGFGYTNSQTYQSPPVVNNNKEAHPYYRYTEESPYLCLMDIMKIRLSFYRYKLGVISDAMKRGNDIMAVKSSLGMECAFFSELSTRPILVDCKKSFQFYHLGGVHFPVLYGRHGEKLNKLVNDGLLVRSPERAEEVYEVIRNYLHFIFESIATHLDWLRKQGIYDNSMIVITCDHGIVNRPKSALLMVKPIGSKSEFSISNAPTTHENIAELMRQSADKNLSQQEVTGILSSDNRRMRIRRPTPEKWWYFGRDIDTYEIRYDKTGKEISSINLGEFDVL